MTVQRFDVGTRLSEMAVHHGVCYLAGQVCWKILDHWKGTRLLMCQIFLADLNDFAGMNEVWEAWLPAGQAPPRATVLAQLAKPQWKVEMVVAAAVQ